MRGEDNLWITWSFNRLEQLVGRLRKAGERVGVEHQAALRGQCHQHEIAGTLADPRPRSDDAALRRLSASRSANSALVSMARIITAVSTDALIASASRGEASVTSPAPARSDPRAASRAAPVAAMSPDTDDGMAAGIFVAVDLRHRKSLAPKVWNILECQGADLAEHAGVDADVGKTHPAAMNPSRQQQMCRLAAEERDGFGRAHGDPHHGTRGAVDAAGKVDAEDRHAARIDGLDDVRADRP